MLIWEKKLPGYLVKKDIIVRTTIFTALFALAFINFYSPFDVEKWFHLNKLQLFFYSSLVILTGMAVIVISRVIMYQVSKIYQLDYLRYSIWIFAEMFSMATVYSLFVKFILEDSRLMSDIIRITVRNTVLVLLLPYTVLWLYFAYREKTKQLEKYSSKLQQPQISDKMIPFFDDKGKLKFSVVQDDILYLEASDNYVSIYYSSKEKISKYMIRNTLKNLEDKLVESGFIRCHRSFLVNFNKVKILKREKDGLFLELDAVNPLQLPVSKTYVSSVVESFSQETA